MWHIPPFNAHPVVYFAPPDDLLDDFVFQFGFRHQSSTLLQLEGQGNLHYQLEEEDDEPDLGDDDEILIEDILDLPQLMGMIDSSTYKEAEDRVIEAVKKHKIKSVNQWKKKKIILTLVPDLNPKLLK